MATLVLDPIQAPIAGADPCGADLEYDATFAELERLAQGKPEQQIGSTIVPAEEPDWKTVQSLALELLSRSKDLRVAVHLTKALLRTSGWNGFSQGLVVLRDFVDSQWLGIYPRLDPDDDNDPTMRVNILNSIADTATVGGVRATVLVSSRTLGRFSLRDLEVASGDAGAIAGASAPTMSSLDAAAMDSDLAELQAAAAAIRTTVEALAALEASVAAHVGGASGVNYSKLAPLVRKASSFLTAKVAVRVPQATDGMSNGAGNTAGSEAGAGIATRGGIPGEIGSREDVISALDKIAMYYTRHEPSSPIPLFMARCKRLVMMSFIDIVRELVPEAVSQVEVLKGRTE